MTDHNVPMRTRADQAGSWALRMLSGLGLLTLLSAVVFWWGGVVGPQIFALIFPQLLPLDTIPDDLNPNLDGTLANMVSTAAFLVVAFLSCVNGAIGYHRKSGWVVVGGWIVLALTLTFLAVEDLDAVISRGQNIIPVGGYQVHWMLLVSPLILAFLLAMFVFIREGRLSGEVRALLTLGIVVWLPALLLDLGPGFSNHRFIWLTAMATPLEETLEFGGALLFGLSAMIALHRRDLGILRRSIIFPLVVGSLTVVALIVSLVIALMFRAPFVDARSGSNSEGRFYIALKDEMSAVQELRMPEIPVKELEIRLISQDSHGRSGILIWRVIDGGLTGDILREGRLRVAAGEHAIWSSIEFDPPLSGVGGRRLGLQLVADVEDGGHLAVAATKANLYSNGRLWVNGELTWPDQDLEFVAFSATEPTRSKLQAVWLTFASDWLWPVLLVNLGLSLVLVTLMPTLVLAAVVLSVAAQRR